MRRFSARSPPTAERKAKVDIEPTRRLSDIAPRPAAEANRTDRQKTIRGRRFIMLLLAAFMASQSGGATYEA